MAHIVVVGGSLPGIATSLRLARVGHDVTLLERRKTLGGRFGTPGAWAPILDFPAPLKDLFRKSGRPFDAELARRGLALAEAPDAVHVFADGTRLPWPTDRGRQWHVLAERYGTPTADRWRGLLDDLDATWQRLRPLGLEGELTDRRQLRALRGRPGRTLEDLARGLDHPHLSEIVRAVAWRTGSEPARTPAWLASRLSVERLFGRWYLADAEGHPLPPSVLFDVLADRLATRRVRVLTSTAALGISGRSVRVPDGELPADAVASTVSPWRHSRLLDAPRLTERLRSARLSPARAPLVSVAHDGARHPLSEEIRHTPDGPVITFRLPGASGTQTIIHDHAGGAPARSAGVAWRGPGSWLTRPGVRASGREGLYVASAASRGGNEPWAQLLTAALVAYAAHGSLTGEDIRPANRDYRP